MKNILLRLRMWRQFTILLLGILNVALIGWCAQQLIARPHLNALWTARGVVYYARAVSPLQIGDRILEVEGEPFDNDALVQLLETSVVQSLDLKITRAQTTLTFPVAVTSGFSFLIQLVNLVPIAVALSFWGTGVYIFIFGSRSGAQAYLFFLACQAVGTILAAGTLVGHGWTRILSTALTWWVVPLALHFHLYFPRRTITLLSRWGVLSFYVIALSGSAPFLLFLTPLREQIGGFTQSFSSIYSIFHLSFLLGGVLLVLGLLLRAYHSAVGPALKRQVGLVTLSGGIALLPLIGLTLLPEILTGVVLVPTAITYLLLAFLPIGYGYAIRRFRLIGVERYVSRSAALLFVFVLLSGGFYLVDHLLSVSVPQTYLDLPFVKLGVAMVPVILVGPLYRRFQIFVNRLLYGGWYDYSSVLSQVTTSLDQKTDIEGLAHSLSQTIQEAMRVYWVALFLPAMSGRTAAMAVAGRPEDLELPADFELSQDSALVHCFRERMEPLAQHDLHTLLPQETLTAVERDLVGRSRARLFVPLRGVQDEIGILVLGPKYDGDVFDRNDLRILDVVARQSGIALQNAQLIAKLEERVAENESYQRRVMRVREEERRRLARELHDQVIQILIGFKYGLSNIQTTLGQLNGPGAALRIQADELQNEVNQLVQTTRSMCLNLRPPALDLGLVPSIRSVVNRYELLGDMDIDLQVNGQRDTLVGEDVALSLFRCTQEALQNIYKHAGATKVEVNLEMRPDCVQLKIADNGVGFELPDRLGTLMNQNHFGLVGMRERIELVDGVFQIYSNPGAGTVFEARVPIMNGSNNDAEEAAFRHVVAE